jgi:hypothetical protein
VSEGTRFAIPRLVHERRGVVDEVARRLDVDSRIRHHELDRLMVDQRLAERPALAGVGAFGEGEAAGAGGDAAVLEDDVGRGHAEHAHLSVAPRDGEAGESVGTTKAVMAFSPIIGGLGKVADEVGDRLRCTASRC